MILIVLVLVKLSHGMVGSRRRRACGGLENVVSIFFLRLSLKPVTTLTSTRAKGLPKGEGGSQFQGLTDGVAGVLLNEGIDTGPAVIAKPTESIATDRKEVSRLKYTEWTVHLPVHHEVKHV